MAKRYFLSLLALMFCFNAFSQTQISTAGEFLAISSNPSGSYIQTADIDLGDRGDLTSAIIPTFSGVYDGGGYTISYTASFTASGDATSYALFGSVTGTIKNLNLNGSVTMSGDASDLRLSLLCGYLNSGGTIQSCNVSGIINSTADAGFNGNAGTGMIAGRCDGTIKYCTASGSVTGPGYAGGITGQMGGIRAKWGYPPIEYYEDGTIIGCSFVGSVTSTSGGWLEGLIGCGSFAGGICGFATSNSKIDLCYVNADISSTIATGAGGTNNRVLLLGFATGKPTVTNNYCQGTVNGSTIGADDITNSAGETSYNYYPGGSTQNGGTSMIPDSIAVALNNAAQNAGEGSNVHFSTVGDGDDKEVVFGQQVTKVCETPTNLTITNNAGTYTASWQIAGSDNTITESKWRWNLSGGNLATALQGEVNATTLPSQLDASPNPYVFTVYTDCSSEVNGLLSGSASIEFFVDCPKPTGLTASSITDNGFTVNWTSSVDCQVILGSNVVGEVTTDGSSKAYTFTGLNPETTYNVTIKAKCGAEYEEEASISVTTARLSAPTNLEVNTEWQSTSGKATITWNAISGITYEVNTEGNTKTTPYVETGLAVGNYTVKVRAKKGDKYSDWVSMPYTISNPPAPKNPQVEYTQNGNAYDVTVTWTEGSATNNGWTVNGNNVNVKSYTLTSQEPGSESSLSIIEKTGQNTSAALIVPIQVPCLPATLPTNVSTTQTTATLTFSSEIANRQVIIGSTVYDAPNVTLEITGLESGMTYSYEVKEYCGGNNQYDSTTNGTFTTVACYTVANLSTSNVGINSATVSWQSQSSLSGLQYQIVLKKGNEVVSTDVQATTTKTFSGLTKATNYTVEVREKCGSGWGNEKTVSFTTLGDYSTVKSGNFNTATIWEGRRVPTGNDGGDIIINQGHVVTLSSTFVLSSGKVLNQGVLQIIQQGELINTTSTNVGGIVEIETPQKTINQWTFIGAPFENNYPLGVIKPVSGSDISVSQFNTEGNWSDEWATVYTTIGVAEGLFAWPFYGGAVTFTTYGDVCTWDESLNDGEGDWEIGKYDFNQVPATALNNAETITVTKSLTTSSGGKWMALANPYPFKLKVATFLADNILSENNPDPNSNNVIQGEVIYKFNGTSWTTHNSGDINMTEGFFVNFTNGGAKTATFKKTQRLENQAKSSRTPREFVKFALVDGKKEVDLLFAHNQEAEQNYDIYDANKMFSPVEIAEPYFVTEGIALVKEEVKELPYYATMNVRSYKDDTVSFVVKNIPKDMSVFIIDNEEEIKMSEDVAYTTHISEGENADRFQVLFKKASVIEEAKDSEITITNTNRLVRVESTQTDLRIEVYNALGQKVFATNDYNFTLNEVSAGTYMIKAYNRITTQTAKIVVE